MRRSLTFFALLALTGVGVFAQTRDSIRIYVQSTAANPSHALYFRESFAAEIEAAGYALAYRAAAADYILNLGVMPNIIPYDDGTRVQAPPNERQFILQVGLVRSRDSAEIASFSFPFSYTAEVEPFNQYLFYQIMQNLPGFIPEYTPPVQGDTGTPQPPPDGFVGQERIIREVPGPERIVEVPVEVVRVVEVPGPERVVEVPGPERIVEVPGPERIVEVPGPERVVVKEVPRAVEVEVIREVPVPVPVPVHPEPVREVPYPVPVPIPEPVRDVPVHVPAVREKPKGRVILPEGPDLWRNKWLYLRASVDVPFNYFQVKPDQNPGYKDRLIVFPPGASFGLEAQFLNWMSVELDLTARFADVVDYAFNPGAALQLKFPLKPASYFMLEPYLGVAFSLNTAIHSDTPFYLNAGGGLQLGMRGGEAGAWFVDLNYLHTLNNFLQDHISAVKEVSTNSPQIFWNRYVIGLSVGYKFGFIDRVQRR